VIVSEEFIGDKSFRAKGKRLTNYIVDKINVLEPVVLPEDEEPVDEMDGDVETEIEEQLEPQMSLFDVEDLKEE
jgi:topoisomerase-4 subunit A